MKRLNLSKRELVLGGVVVVVILLLALSWFKPLSKSAESDDSVAWDEAVEPEEAAKSADDESDSAQEAKSVVVDVKGAVQTSGVYEVDSGKRVVDVIEEAGGFTKKADEKQINLAEQVRDEMVIYVPKQGEEVKAWSGGGGEGGESEQGNEKIALNAAKESELEELPGVGPAKAKAITDYREEHGPFKKVEDLVNVSGIGEKTLEKLKDQLRL